MIAFKGKKTNILQLEKIVQKDFHYFDIFLLKRKRKYQKTNQMRQKYSLEIQMTNKWPILRF